MAIVDTIPTLEISRQPIERPDQSATLWSIVPRGIIHFFADGATLDAKPVNDQQHLRLSGVLPQGFAHSLISVSLTITQDVAANWVNRCVMRCVNWIPGSSASPHLVFLLEDSNEFADAAAVSPVGVLRQSETTGTGFGNGLIYTIGAAQTSFSMLAANESAAAGAAGTVDFLASFYEYDLTQALRYPLASPVPITNR